MRERKNSGKNEVIRSPPLNLGTAPQRNGYATQLYAFIEDMYVVIGVIG